jgi:hypothetical protein
MPWSRPGPLIPPDLEGFNDVTTRRLLTRAGVTNDAIRAHLHARRWRQVGKAVVLHNGPITLTQRHRIILIKLRPTSRADVVHLRGGTRSQGLEANNNLRPRTSRTIATAHSWTRPAPRRRLATR